jgi:hypothetical protein
MTGHERNDIRSDMKERGVGTGAYQGSTLTMHQQTLTIGPSATPTKQMKSHPK